MIRLMRTTFTLVALALFLSACGSDEKPTTGYADFRDMQVYYEDHPGAEPALVFIHCWAGNTEFWREQVPAFAGDHRVLVLDLPGHGNSDKPKPSTTFRYSMDMFGDAVVASMDAAGVERAALIGNSMGFPVAIHAAKRHPARVLGLVGVDGALDRVPKEPEELKKWQAQYDRFLTNFRSDAYAAFTADFVGSLHHAATPQDVREFVIDHMLKTPQYVMVSAMEAFADPATWREAVIDVPTLAVYVRNQWLPEDNEEHLRSLFPNLTYVEWDDAGHFLQLDRPERFNKLLEDWQGKEFAD